MARIFYIHWHKDEALDTVHMLRAAGHTVSYHHDTGEEAWRLLKDTPPDVLVVSLDRLPSHGRRVASVTLQTKRLRHVPVVFVGGETDKLKVAIAEFPAAHFCSVASLIATLDRLEKSPAAPAAETKPAAPRPAGYSGTPLPQKLGIQANHRVALVNAPDGLEQVLGDLPPGVQLGDDLRRGREFDVILLFTRDRAQLTMGLKSARARLAPTGGLWIAWPKKASGIATDLSENVIRDCVLATGLVDNKVCAIDETWSGLRFVIRVADRPKSAE